MDVTLFRPTINARGPTRTHGRHATVGGWYPSVPRAEGRRRRRRGELAFDSRIAWLTSVQRYRNDECHHLTCGPSLQYPSTPPRGQTCTPRTRRGIRFARKKPLFRYARRNDIQFAARALPRRACGHSSHAGMPKLSFRECVRARPLFTRSPGRIS